MIGRLALAALPVLAGLWLGLGPPAWFWGGGFALAIGAVLVLRARWRPGAAGALAALACGALASLAGGALWAALAPAAPAVPEQRRDYVLDLDARVAPLPLPRCGAQPAEIRVLLERGAHPRMDAEGRFLVFDAEGPSGRRQVHRLERATEQLACLTCGEPGNNRRPHPAAGGRGLVFDSDRHATLRDPLGTDVHFLALGAEPELPSRRITFAPGPDDHALLDPAGAVLVWSRSERGRFAVVAARLRRGHGALAAGRPGVLYRGGVHWVAPLAWAANGRSLAIAEGQPLGPARVRLLEPSSGEVRALADRLHPVAGVAFSADGDQRAEVGVAAAGALARLPGGLGFAVARLAALAGVRARLAPASVRVAAPDREAMALDLGEAGAWGAATGIALEPDGRGFVLGQRAGEAERLLAVRLACDGSS